MARGGQFIDVNGYLREADGRFARSDGTTPGRSSGTRRKSTGGKKRKGASYGPGGADVPEEVLKAAKRKGGSRSKTTPEKVVLAGADIGGEKLRKSKDKRKRVAGVVLSAVGSVMRNRNVRSAVRRGV